MDNAPELEILLIRYGESQFNRTGIGVVDSPLTELGIAQARRLGPWLATHFKTVALYSSTMMRARQTAELI